MKKLLIALVLMGGLLIQAVDAFMPRRVARRNAIATGVAYNTASQFGSNLPAGG